MLSDIDTLARSIAERRTILFVGAGVSMSVGLPSWQTLIDHMIKELGLDDTNVGGRECSYQTLAEFYRLKQGSIGPLRSWMDSNWQVSPDRVRASRLHQLIVSLDFPIIYTTNYDRNLETAFEIHGRDFVKIAHAKDLTRIREGVTQVIKYHGDFDDDTSLVLTETDYFNRLAFDSPLDVKFRADALGRAILFIGYSMSDMNIRLLLHRLWETWSASGFEKDRPGSFVFMTSANPVQETVLDRWGITVLSGGEGDPDGDPGAALCTFMSELKSRIEAGDIDRCRC